MKANLRNIYKSYAAYKRMLDAHEVAAKAGRQIVPVK